MGCDRPLWPFVAPASTSTVADAYRWLNHTVGNRTVVEDGYYYLNNFDNVLNSFGECRNRRWDAPRACRLGHPRSRRWRSQAVWGLLPQMFATLPHVLSGPEGACGLPGLEREARPGPLVTFSDGFQ